VCHNGGTFHSCAIVQTFKEAESSVFEFTVMCHYLTSFRLIQPSDGGD